MEFIIKNNIELHQLTYHIKKNLTYNMIAFYGEMGAGKTTLIRSFCKQLGTKDHVNSPSFSILNEYHFKEKKIYHFDFYRIEKIEEVYDLGYEEYFFSNEICLIEWAERIESLLPINQYHHISISIIDENTRKISFL